MDKKVDIIKDADDNAGELVGYNVLRQEYWYVMQKTENCICMTF